MPRGRLLVLLTVILTAVSSGSAAAATINVNTTQDETTSGCSLREAVTDVDSAGATAGGCTEATSGANEIVLPDGRYYLTSTASGPLEIVSTVSNLVITGAGASKTTIDATQLSNSAFTIDSGAMVTIEDVTITGGHAPDGAAAAAGANGNNGANGGGILNSGTLILRQSALVDNSAGNGSGGTNPGSEGASGAGGGNGGSGGAIYSTAKLTVLGVTFTGNDAGSGGAGGDGVGSGAAGGAGGGGGSGGAGGAVFNDGGTLSVSDSTFKDNTAGAGGAGGAGAGAGEDGGAAGNGGTGGSGGAIADGGGSVGVTNTTLASNDAGAGGAGGAGGEGGSTQGGAGGNGGPGGQGGGVFNDGGRLTVARSTLSTNADGPGGNGGDGGTSGGGSGGEGGTGGPGGSGGAIGDDGGSLMTNNSTLASNLTGAGGDAGNGGSTEVASGGDGGDGGNGGNGAGVDVTTTSTGGAQLNFVTVASNTPGAGGNPGSGGTSTYGSAGSAGFSGTDGSTGGVLATGLVQTILSSTLLASNAAGNCGGGEIEGAGVNLSFGDSSCPNTFLSGNPKLGSLQNNGGPTQTIDLGSGSAARNKVAHQQCLPTDQRGVSRASGPDCDLGAYEVEPPAVTVNSPTARTSSGATLHASVTANSATATVQFEYGTTESYGTKTPVQTVAGVRPAEVARKLSKLEPGTTYHYAVIATATDGSTTSKDHTFKTLAAPRISKLKIDPPSFAAGHGATVSFSDSDAGTVDFLLRRCTKDVTSTGECTKYQKAGTFSHPAIKGTNSFHWSGKLAATQLKSGSYLLVATPVADGVSGSALSTGFRVT